MRVPLPLPSEIRVAIEAAGGWNAALPSPPATRSASRTPKLDALPISERNTAATAGPPTTKSRRP